jgi:hypothetical protein
MVVLQQFQSSKNDDLLVLEDVVLGFENLNGSRDVYADAGSCILDNRSRVVGVE